MMLLGEGHFMGMERDAATAGALFTADVMLNFNAG